MVCGIIHREIIVSRSLRLAPDLQRPCATVCKIARTVFVSTHSLKQCQLRATRKVLALMIYNFATPQMLHDLFKTLVSWLSGRIWACTLRRRDLQPLRQLKHFLLARRRKDLPNNVDQGLLLLSTLGLGGVVQVLM